MKMQYVLEIPDRRPRLFETKEQAIEFLQQRDFISIPYHANDCDYIFMGNSSPIVVKITPVSLEEQPDVD